MPLFVHSPRPHIAHFMSERDLLDITQRIRNLRTEEDRLLSNLETIIADRESTKDANRSQPTTPVAALIAAPALIPIDGAYEAVDNYRSGDRVEILNPATRRSFILGSGRSIIDQDRLAVVTHTSGDRI